MKLQVWEEDKKSSSEAVQKFKVDPQNAHARTRADETVITK